MPPSRLNPKDTLDAGDNDMSGNWRGGGPPMFKGRQPSGQNGSSPVSRYDREREEREREALRYGYENRNRGVDRGRDRDDRDDRDNRERRTERARSRSPYRHPENRRPPRHDSPRSHDRRDSSSVMSSKPNSPTLSTRALNVNNHLPAKPIFELPPPTGPRAIQPVALPSSPDHQAPFDSSSLNLFTELIEEFSHTSALGVHLITARATYTDRVSDFDKSIQLHAKFPSVKNSQSDAKDQAESKYLAIKQQAEEQASKVNSLATRTMEVVIPQIASMATSAKEKELQQRCASLEKSHQELLQHVNILSKYIKDIQDSNALKDAEERIKQEIESESTKFTKQFEAVNSRLSHSINDINVLRTETTASVTRVESGLNQVLSFKSKFDTHCETAEKYMAEQTPLMNEELTLLKNEIEGIKNTPQPPAAPEPSNNINDSISLSHGNRIMAVEKSASALTDRLDKIEHVAFEDRIAKLESAQEDSTVEDRIAKLENSCHDFKLAETANTESIPNDFLPKFTKLEKDLRTIRDELDTVNTSQVTLIQTMSASMNELIEDAIDKEVPLALEPMQGSLDQMKNTLQSYQDQGLVGLLARVQALETLNENGNHVTDTNDMKRNLTAVIHTKVIQSIQADPLIVSQTQLNERLSEVQAANNSTLAQNNNILTRAISDIQSLQNSDSQRNQEVQALQNVTHNHETRMNNLSTGQMVSYLIDQLKETVPDLYIVGSLRAEIESLSKKVNDLTADTRTLFTFSKKNDESQQKLEKDVKAMKETSSVQFTNLIVGAEDLVKRINGIQERANSSEKPTSNNLKPELDALKKEFATLKETQIQNLIEQVKALDTEKLQEKIPDNILTQFDGIENRLKSLEKAEPVVSQDRLEEINEQLTELSETQKKISGMEAKVTAQQQQQLKFNKDLENLLLLDGKVIEVTKAIEELKGIPAKLTELVDEKFASILKQIEALKQQQARPTHLNTTVNGVDSGSSPNASRSGSIQKSRQGSTASTTCDSIKTPNITLPPLTTARQPSTSTPRPSAPTPKSSTPASTTNGTKHRSNDMNKSRPSANPNRSRTVRPDTYKPVEKPIASDIHQSNKKRKQLEQSTKPNGKRVKGASAFMTDNNDDDNDESLNNFERPSMAADDVDGDSDCMITSVVKKPEAIPRHTAVVGEDQDFKRKFS